jgi:hypothetical protein
MNVKTNWLPGVLRLRVHFINDDTSLDGRYITNPSAIQNVR